MHILSICTLWSWPRPNMINHLWLNISSIHTKKIYIYFYMNIFSLHKNSITAWQPLWLLIYTWISSPSTQDGCGLATTVYSFYTHNMVTAQQPLLLLIHRCITSPYTQYGHGPAPMWLISYDWISLPYVQKKKSSLYEYHLYTENIVTAWQPLWLLIYTWISSPST